ncbi:MAG: chorismate mutase [Clostridia bacterium]
MIENNKVVAIRGATTTKTNTEKEILAKTEVLLKKILKENNIEIERIISIIFTLTNDLDAIYPARAARDIGIREAALMCAQEIPVPNSLKKCIRVMLHCYHPVEEKVRHIYLENAKTLRPDLMENQL